LVIKQGQNGFLIGQLKELPAVFTQGLSVDELKENIADVLEMYSRNHNNGKSTFVPRHADIDTDLCTLVRARKC